MRLPQSLVNCLESWRARAAGPVGNAPEPSPGMGGGSPRRAVTLFSALLTAAVVGAMPGGLAPAMGMPSSPAVATHAGTVAFRELYRPQFHYTPAKNWMNDPNGLVFYKGKYHLFYQYNPAGSTWGNISWGHAVSRDLVHWTELPVAIPADDQNFIFSGSVVVDERNTSGFGTAENPPLVAIYTAATKACCRQAQAVAYSLDDGLTWTKYAGNPVLDIGSGEFRDPKVFWYAPGRRWVMSVVLATEHKVSFYGSTDLKAWTHLSDFGPANATGGVWEVPDLFPLPVDGNPKKIKWVLVVNINPGGIAGGSGAQYFVGDFDGIAFHADADSVAGPYTPPAGDVYAAFEGADFGPWTVTGTAFGDGPAPGNAPGQGGVTGYVGAGVANSFHNFDAGTGSLTSPAFTITKPYVNFLIGGGNHPHVAGTVDSPPPPGTVYADFEGTTYGTGWTATGTFAGTQPPAGTIGDQQPVSGYEGTQLINTFIDHDNGTGVISSPDFTIASPYINLLVGGGHHPYPGGTDNPPTSVNLVVGGQVVKTATGTDSEALNWTAWDVSGLQGQTAHIEALDQNTGGWGHILADQITFADQPARPRSIETAANLLVDGQVVRSGTGRNSETLDWTSWNVNDLIGRTAQIQLLDNNTGGWGHTLVDQVTFADAPARSVEERSNWLDYGKDYYAAVSWNNVPDGTRVMIGWMNNWNYAGAIPTAPWRSAMSVPREVTLRTVAGKVQVVQKPWHRLDGLRAGSPFTFENRVLATGTTVLADPRAHGKALDIEATFDIRTATTFGLSVRTGAGEQTVIGYDVPTGEVYVDRTRSGDATFSADFAGVQRVPLAPVHGLVKLRVLVDWSSVEVFAGGGQRVITDQIFPSDSSRGVSLFSDGGSTRVSSLKIWRMRSTR